MTDRTKTDKPNSALARRDLFRVAGLGVGALGAVAVGAVAVTGPAEAALTDSTTTTGYRETDHVRKVYELSRF